MNDCTYFLDSIDQIIFVKASCWKIKRGSKDKSWLRETSSFCDFEEVTKILGHELAILRILVRWQKYEDMSLPFLWFWWGDKNMRTWTCHSWRQNCSEKNFLIEWLLLLRIKTEHEPALFRVNNGLRGYILHILRFWIWGFDSNENVESKLQRPFWYWQNADFRWSMSLHISRLSRTKE